MAPQDPQQTGHAETTGHAEVAEHTEVTRHPDATGDVLERVGRPDQAARLRAQAKLLTTYFDPPAPPST